MTFLRAIVNRYPLTAFAIAAYALSWWSIPFAAGGILPHGPFVAALIILALTRGGAPIKNLFARMLSWSGGWHWLLIAPGLVVVYLGLALAVNVGLGATLRPLPHLDTFGPAALGLLFLGGLWEEPGWTGYALPLLQERYAKRRHGSLLASFHLGAIRAVWHLPLVFSGAIPWYDMVFFSFAFQLLISWLFKRTGGSVLIVMLFHLASNVIGGALMIRLFAGADYERYYLLFIAMAWLLALLLALADNRRTHLHRTRAWGGFDSSSIPVEPLRKSLALPGRPDQDS